MGFGPNQWAAVYGRSAPPAPCSLERIAEGYRQRAREDRAAKSVRADPVVRSIMEVPGAAARLNTLADRWETLAWSLPTHEDRLKAFQLAYELRSVVTSHQRAGG
jgi:hypothetical protein